jgi:CheY-like chemotaxis protein/glycine cleavage system H lipoate-binding protein
MSGRAEVLVIDDEAVVTDAALKICAGEGVAAESAAGGEEGLARLRRGGHRLVLCDIMMEDRDGFEILEAVRSLERPPVTVMITGYSTVEHAVRSLNEGALDFLPKPFTADELTAVVRRGLAYERLRDGPIAPIPCPPSFYRLGGVSWCRLERGGTALLGVCDGFLKSLPGVETLRLDPPGEELYQGGFCAVLRAADGLEHRVLCPLGGKILEANAPDPPAALEKDPFFDGWLYRVVPSSPENDIGLLTSCSSDRR